MNTKVNVLSTIICGVDKNYNTGNKICLLRWFS